MKISCAQIETPIILTPDNPFLLCIENPNEFYRVVTELVSAFNGEKSEFTFWENDKQINADSVGEILTELFTFDLTDKKTVSLLHKKLQQNFSQSALLFEFEKVKAEAEKFLVAVCEEENFSLEYGEIQFDTLLKACAVKPEKTYDTLLEKIVCFINIYIELKGCYVFAFVGLKSVLDDEELKLLYKHCQLHKVSLLLIENSAHRALTDNERAIIITQDLCEIIENFN